MQKLKDQQRTEQQDMEKLEAQHTELLQKLVEGNLGEDG